MLGRSHMSTGNYAGAVAAYERVVELESAQNAQGLVDLGEDGPGAGEQRHLDVRHERERRNDHLVTGAYTASYVNAIAFNALDYWPSEASVVRLAYKLDVNYYRGRESAEARDGASAV